MDNKSSIHLTEHRISHGRSKYIETRFLFIRDEATKEKLVMEYCRACLQVADIMTKALKIESFIRLRSMMGMIAKENNI